ncbi:hypothetical protein [Streptomyces zingiberis]|uniref:Secreted protein n=1 Tax=Streptomyces zingiberis TaxID=2053010 RepID=A0ABX1BZ07_9ACTN|nr:hypothetical protein [Streptomyces zingiberis]NJQ02924.1 hypothetical protein [Streptomyces zingiberis]
MPNDHPGARPARPVPPSPRRLLALVLGALLLTGLFHCPVLPALGHQGQLPSPTAAGGTAPHTATAPQGEPGHSHHGAACTSPGLIPQIQGASDAPTRAAAPPAAGAAPVVAAAGLPALRRRRRGRRTAIPGRSVLCRVCRWRS